MKQEGIKHDLVRQTFILTDDQSHSWLKLIRDRRWSRRQKHFLLDHFGTPDDIYRADDHQLRLLLPSWDQNKETGFDQQKYQNDIDWLTQKDAFLIPRGDERYPALLNEISDPPLALFALGDVSLINRPQVAIVGSRRPTPVGSKITTELAKQLSDSGIIITSGMALGIDGLAHQGALEQGNATVAVMGCGLDIVYPARHQTLFNSIRDNGLLLSEYPLGYQPSKYSFPERNRVVSGLSLGVVIIEAAEKSGTLITARLALEQNREVMVVPGSVLSKQYRGSHQLLRDGAALISGSQDVLNNISHCFMSAFADIDVHYSNSVNNAEGSDSQLLKYIFAESTPLEDIISNSGLTAAEVSSMLLMLELENKVAIADDGGYVNVS